MSNSASQGGGIDMSQFFQVFFDECAEHLATMESLLLAIDPATASSDDLNAIFRAAHSMKGGAGTFGFTDMTDVTDGSNLDGAKTTTTTTPRRRWQPLTARAFRWMVDAIHRQLLGEYRGWAVDANDNSDEFIETSMRFGAIIVGGNMEWSSFMGKLKNKMWTLAVDGQTGVAMSE